MCVFLQIQSQTKYTLISFLSSFYLLNKIILLIKTLILVLNIILFGQFGNWALKKVIWTAKKKKTISHVWVGLVVLLWPKTFLKNNITSPLHNSYSKVQTPKKVKLKWKTVIATHHGPPPTILESRPFKIPKINSIYHEGKTDLNHSLTPPIHLQITSLPHSTTIAGIRFIYRVLLKFQNSNQ